jgi:hypothetical protein
VVSASELGRAGRCLNLERAEVHQTWKRLLSRGKPERCARKDFAAPYPDIVGGYVSIKSKHIFRIIFTAGLGF